MSANGSLWLKSGFGVVLVVTALAAVTGCGAREEAARPDAATAAQQSPEPTEVPTALPAGFAPLVEPFTGDLDGMI